LNEHRGGIYATWLEDAGIPARVIDELMGHEATSRGGQQRGSAMGPTTGTPREMAARLATAIQQGLTVVLEVAEQVLEAPDPSQFGPRRLLIPLVGLLIGVLPILGYTLQFGAKQRVGVFSFSVAVALAAGLVGCFLGFLFAIPRFDITDRDLQDVGKYGRAGWLHNTNLSQISD
jgi:hypothetical protein